MMVTLRLYRQHDLDLITLYRHPSFSLPNAMKRALCGYVRNEKFFIKQPPTYELGNEKISKIVQMHIQLSDKTEGDVIKWLKGIKEGYRNSVLKNVIRSYMAGPCVYSYSINKSEAESLALDVIDNFESNIRETIEIKGRGYTKPVKKKVDTRKVEDSVIAKTILSDNNKPQNKNVFVERINDDNVDIKKLEEITKTESKEETKKETPKIQETVVKNEPIVENDDSAETLDDMLDDIDAMMGEI